MIGELEPSAAVPAQIGQQQEISLFQGVVNHYKRAKHVNRQTQLFSNFPYQTGLRGFIALQFTAWKFPLSPVTQFRPAPGQQHFPLRVKNEASQNR